MEALLERPISLNNSFPLITNLPKTPPSGLQNTPKYAPGGDWQSNTPNELLAFDVRLYIMHALEGAGINFEAIKKDSLGLITEKVSAEDIFPPEIQIALQLTPPKHEYIQVKRENKPSKFVSPEFLDEENLENSKDIVETMTNWRRGLDIRAMEQVKKQAEEAEVGTKFLWVSPKAKDWEAPEIKKYNGIYGYAYCAEVVEEAGIRKLVVHDYKNDLDAESYYHFMLELSPDKNLRHREGQEDEEFLDKVMTTVAEVKPEQAQDLTQDQIWRRLSQSREVIMGDSKIFKVEVDEILGLQSPELHKKIEDGAATEIARWITDEITRGTSSQVIQSQVRSRFIEVTRQAISESIFAKYLSTNEMYQTTRFESSIRDYSGSSGDFCGDWVGSSESNNEGDGKVGGKCRLCGIYNNCTQKCYKCGGELIR